MTTSSTPPSSGDKEPRDTSYWAQQVSTIRVTRVPTGALDLNMEGHHLVGPLQGFGQMWQKIYWVVLKESKITPTELVKVWKEHFPTFWPKASHFYPSLHGIAPGEIALLSSPIPGGLPVPVSTGVFVLYADDESFTFMTPQGHMFAGWITFSGFAEDAGTTAQIQVLIRPNDPIYELGWFVMRRMEDRFWKATMVNVAAHVGVPNAVVEEHTNLVDKHRIWRNAGNVWHNAAIRSVLHLLSAPIRRIRRGRGH